MEELSRSEFLAAIVILTALTSASVFGLLWLFWLRSFQRRIEDLGKHLHGDTFATSTGIKTQKLEPTIGEGELVATFKLSNSDQTISIIEENGKYYLQGDGELSEDERNQMLRYLRNEGFLG